MIHIGMAKDGRTMQRDIDPAPQHMHNSISQTSVE
jgi:hypothetical protein